ncbi:MAG: GntR family transcriptional regulator [Tepidisphaerales bacterium]
MFIRIDPSSGMPITRQIAEQIRTQCASGAVAPGDRLPSVRQLAQELAVNQNTVLRVYERLTVEGLLERRHGDGTYVADHLPAGQMKAQRQLLRTEVERLVQRVQTLGLGADDLCKLVMQAFEQAAAQKQKGVPHE